jgi:uncharacterized membrane protein
MKTPNKVLMTQARETLKDKWEMPIKVTVIYILIEIALAALGGGGTIISFAISGPLTVGLTIFWLAFSRNEDTKVGMMLEGFDTWFRSFKAFILIFIFTLLWTLLLIIPGLIASFAYSQVYFILAEDKTIGANAALDKSRAMMKGNKWKLFCLCCRFIGWFLLCLLTLGIGFIWFIPYFHTTLAKFYDDIKKGNEVVPEVVEVPAATV